MGYTECILVEGDCLAEGPLHDVYFPYLITFKIVLPTKFLKLACLINCF